MFKIELVRAEEIFKRIIHGHIEQRYSIPKGKVFTEFRRYTKNLRNSAVF